LFFIVPFNQICIQNDATSADNNERESYQVQNSNYVHF